MINALYVVSGLLLPLFYLPQILRLLADKTNLESYSVSKSAIQLLLRIPALAFAIFTVNNDLMTMVLTLDLMGRAAEVAAAYRAMRRQGADRWTCMRRFVPAWTHIRRLYERCRSNAFGGASFTRATRAAPGASATRVGPHKPEIV